MVRRTASDRRRRSRGWGRRPSPSAAGTRSVRSAASGSRSARRVTGSSFRFRVVDDATDVRASIVGVVGALRAATHELCVMLPVDCPLVTADALRDARARRAETTVDAAVPQTGPLPGAYRDAALPVFETALEAGRLALCEVLEQLRVSPSSNSTLLCSRTSTRPRSFRGFADRSGPGYASCEIRVASHEHLLPLGARADERHLDPERCLDELDVAPGRIRKRVERLHLVEVRSPSQRAPRTRARSGESRSGERGTRPSPSRRAAGSGRTPGSRRSPKGRRASSARAT